MEIHFHEIVCWMIENEKTITKTRETRYNGSIAILFLFHSNIDFLHFSFKSNKICRFFTKKKAYALKYRVQEYATTLDQIIIKFIKKTSLVSVQRSKLNNFYHSNMIYLIIESVDTSRKQRRKNQHFLFGLKQSLKICFIFLHITIE